MSSLEEMQFELLPSLSAEDGFVFGIGASVSVDDGGFLPGDDNWENQNEANPRRGGVSFGRDRLSGPTHGWDLHVNETSVKTAKQTLGAFKTAWRALHIRNTPGAVLPVRYRLGEEVRRFYGRPYRLSAPPDNLILSGYVPITCDFQAVDGFFYDDEEQSVTLGLAQGSEGGFTFPITFPVTSLPTGLGGDQAVVGGDAPTYPIVRFNGPVENPSLESNDWTLALDRTLGLGEYVEIDLRPWAISVLLNGQASVAGDLRRRTYLADMAFDPGRHELIYRGSSLSSYSTCEVRWSNAHNSL